MGITDSHFADRTIRGKLKQRESAVLTLSDLHFGKKTATFSPDIFETRLEELGAKVKRIHDLLGDYAFDELVIALLGDTVDGSAIYPTQFHHQAITNADEQADILSDLLGKFAQEQKKTWRKVRFECVPGNHGRSSKFNHEAQNYDLTMYRLLELKCKDKGIAVNWNKTINPFVRKINLRGHHFVLYHGHEIRMFQGIPWYGMAMRVFRWLSTRKIGNFDAILMGHFHTTGVWDINEVELCLSGTMVTDDEWALQTLGYESSPHWWLFGVSNSRPITWRFKIDLR